MTASLTLAAPTATRYAAERDAATRYAAARSRGQGPTVALWHAVELYRPDAEIDGACELTVCGSLARIMVEQSWPVAARDVCPACAART